ncbi:MAG TPA: ParB/RepB/Spo0J family partition protein [Methylosinus sp.]|jgi:ParB family chromosome partitioning protein|uniref:ParB/RepB/Spo0J family partition protein n=1 Tax=Methylosinus sp. TaxID=427 RepID=UPI002F93363E
MTTTVPLTRLVMSLHNVRKTEKAANTPALAASILAKGLWQPLAVRQHPDDESFVEIVDGDRRFLAFKLLVEQGHFEADVAVPVYFATDGVISDELMREASLAANIEREPLHPVDEFERFSDLAKTKTPAEIAERFGITKRTVEQRIALGALHPEIREAWRSGDVRDDAAKAFTLALDQDRQLKVFKELQKKQWLYPHQIKSALGVNENVTQALKVIGIDAYRAAGGEVAEDLFGADSVVSDPELAKTLLADRLKQECERLTADGWAFALLADSISNHWNWPRLTPSGKAKATNEETERLTTLENEIGEIEGRGDEDDGLSEEEEEQLELLNAERGKIKASIELRRWGPRQKKTAGCLVGVSYDGDIEITYGVQNPKEVAKKEKERTAAAGGANASAGEAENPAISDKLALALSEQLTIAAAKTLRTEPALALRALVATLEGPRLDVGPLKVRGAGYEAIPDADETGEGAEDAGHRLSVEAVFAELQAQNQDAVLVRLAIAVSKTLDLRRQSARQSLGKGTAALLSALPADMFDISAREVFDPGVYFKGVSAALCNSALDEMGWAMAGGRPKKKGELAAMCVEAARTLFWLPRELRRPAADAQRDGEE